MTKLLTLVRRLVARLVPRTAARGARKVVLSPVERVLQHREHLFGCAMQLLDDEAAAQQIVLEALTQALSGPLAAGSESGRELAPAQGKPRPEAELGGDGSEQRLSAFLDRLVVKLAVTRLKALAVVAAGRGYRPDHDREHESWSSARDGDVGLADGPARGAPPSMGIAGLSDSNPGARASTVSGPLPSAISGSGSGPGLSQPGEQAQLQRTSYVLGQLPTETRVALMLVVMQGRTLAEAAELLGCSAETCRFWLGHGLKLMRRALQRDLIEDDVVSQKARLMMSPGAYNDLRRSKKATARA